MPDDQTYTKEPWIDPSQQVRAPAAQRQSDLEIKEVETHSKPRVPSGAVDTKEGTAAVDTKPVEESVKLSPQVTALARKEAKFRQQEQALKAKELALAEREAKLAKLATLEEKLKAKDYSAAEEFVDYDAYTQYLLDKQKNSDPTQQTLKKLEEKITGIEKSAKDNLTQQFEAAVKERKDAVTKLVESDPEYSTIKELKRQDAVVQHILDTWEHDEVDLPVEQAAKEVEEALIEEAKIYAGLTKLKPPVSEADTKKQLPPLKTKTMTNAMTASDVKTPLKSYQSMSESERYAEARRRAVAKLEAEKAAKAA
jgi:hypothetical protein